MYIPIVTLNRDPNPSSSKSSGTAATSNAACTQSHEGGRAVANKTAGDEDAREKKESVKSSRKENPIPRVSARNEAGSCATLGQTPPSLPTPSVWRSGLVL